MRSFNDSLLYGAPEIIDQSFNDDIFVKNLERQITITILNSKFQKVSLKGVNIYKLVFQDCQFKNFEIQNLPDSKFSQKLDGTIEFNNCSFEEDLIFDFQKFGSIKIYDCKSKKLSIIAAQLQNIEILNFKFKEDYSESISLLIYSKCNWIKLEEIFTKKLEILGVSNLKASAKLRLLSGQILNFSLVNFSISTRSLIEQTCRSNTSDKNLKKYFGHKGEYDSFIIKKCFLNETTFNKTELNQYNTVEFSNSRFLLVNFIGVKWPKNFHYQDPYDAREIFRQIKVCLLESHNNIDALILEKYELDAHLHELRTEKLSFFEKLRTRGHNIFVLLTNKIFSDYGQNFVQPLVWMLFTSVLLYVLIIAALPEFTFIDALKSLKQFGKIFILFNPAHSLDAVNKSVPNNGLAVFLDFLSRAFSSYFIWHIIRGSRKYTRK